MVLTVVAGIVLAEVVVMVAVAAVAELVSAVMVVMCWWESGHSTTDSPLPSASRHASGRRGHQDSLRGRTSGHDMHAILLAVTSTEGGKHFSPANREGATGRGHLKP